MSDHLAAIERHSYEGIADIVIANNAIIPESLRIKYASEHAREVMIDSINVLKRAKLCKVIFCLKTIKFVIISAVWQELL